MTAAASIRRMRILAFRTGAYARTRQSDWRFDRGCQRFRPRNSGVCPRTQTTAVSMEVEVRAEAAEARRDLLIHDIRTPLAAISGYAQLLQRRTLTHISDVAYLVYGLRRDR